MDKRGPMLLNPKIAFKNINDGEKELPKNVVDMCNLGGDQICAIGPEALTFFRLCRKQILVWNLQALRMFPDKRLKFLTCTYVAQQEKMEIDSKASKNEVKEREEKEPPQKGKNEMDLDQ